MKRFVKPLSRGTDVGLENPDSRTWGSPYAQTLRNTSRIEQLEAGQADIRELVKAILSQRWSYPRVVKSPRLVHAGSWCGSPETLDTIEEQQEDIEHWKQVRDVIEDAAVRIGRATLPYAEKLSAVDALYGELEQSFGELPRRIALCALMEEELAALEDLLEDEETEYLGWCVSLIRDVLDYNYAEDFEWTHLELLKKAIELTCKKGRDCNREDYQELHKQFLGAGLALVPTTQKAIENYEE